MSLRIVGKITIYYGSGEAAEERGRRLVAGAKRRGYVDKAGSPELSPLFVYSFEFVDALDAGIEKDAAKRGIPPWEYVNELYANARKDRR